MSTTIDQKVVEMRFDNSDFERNTRQSMSTLEKLKAKLHLKGASDGLEQIGKSAKKVDLSGISSGVQEVSAKFSAMQVIGTTALVNITNSAMAAGKRIVSSLSIDNVTAGWDKMGLKMGSVQTLVNSTGKSVEEIEGYLDKLMWYSDETSYSFTDMTTALANMTSTGGDINKLIPMIMGMANATAFAGKGAAEFSRIIYNLNQSYGAGHLQLMDWKSVQLAGANSKQLTEELIKAGEELGTIKKGQVTIGNFNESLKDKWANTKVMERAFGKFATFTEAVYKYVEENGVAASTAIAKLAKDYDYLSVKALKSAQEAKTFKEAMDATKDAASSGWMKIFTDIFGAYDKQVLIWTDLANTLYDVFVEPINRIEEIVRHAFDFKGVDAMWNKVLSGMDLASGLKDISKQAGVTTKSLEEYQNIVDRVWNGDFKNQPYRKGLLEKEGWNYEAVQELVNLGARDANGNVSWKNSYNGYRLTLQDVIDAELKHNLITADAIKKKEQGIALTNEERKSIEKLTDTTLEKMGLDEEQIRLYHSLQRTAAKYGMSMDDLVKKMKNHNARELLFGKKKLDERGFQVYDEDENAVYEFEGVVQNLGAVIKNVAHAIGQAWREVFDPLGSGELYMAINNLHEFSVKLRKATENEKDMRKLTDTFKGLFSILKLIKTVMGAGFRIAWTIFKTVLETLGYDVLDFTAAVGRMISGFTDFITQNEFVIKGIEWLTKAIANGIITVHSWVKNWISVHDVVKKVTDFLSDFGKGFGTWWQGLKETDNIPKYIFDGLVNGIKEWGGKAIDAMGQIASFMIEKFKQIFGIHSPSTEMFSNGVNIVKGLGEGIWSMASWIFNIIKELAGSILGIVKNMDLGSILFAAVGIGIIYAITRIVKAISAITSLVQGWSDFLTDIGKSAKLLARAASFNLIAQAMKTIAITLAIMVLTLSYLGTKDIATMWEGVKIIAALAIILGLLTLAAVKLGTESKAMLQMAAIMIALGISLKMMSKALKSLTDIDWGKAWPSILGIIILLGGLIAISAIVSNSEKDLLKLGGMFLGIGVCLWIMARVVKTLGKMDPAVLDQGMNTIIKFGIMIGLLIWSTKLLTGKDKSLAKIGSTLLMIGLCFWIMARVVKTLGNMDPDKLSQGKKAITLFALILGAFILATNLLAKGRDKVYKMGNMLLSISAALLLMAFTVKILGRMDTLELIQGTVFIGIFGAMCYFLIKSLSKIKEKDMVNAAKVILSIGAVIMLMAITAGLISILDPVKMAIGTAFVLAFSLMAAGLIAVSRNARLVSYKSILAIAAVIATLALSVGLLSLLKPEKLIAPTIAMGILIGLVIVLISQVGKLNNFKGYGALGMILGLLAELALIVWLLSGFSDNGNAAVSGIAAITLLMVAVAAMMVIADKIPKSSIVSFLVFCVGLLAIAGVMYLLFMAINELKDVEHAAMVLTMITIFLVAMAGVVLLLSAVGVGAVAALAGIGVIAVLVAAVTAIVLLLGALYDYKQMVENGLEILKILLVGIGEAIAGFVGAVFVKLAKDLSTFGEELSRPNGFIESMKKFNGGVLKGIGILSASVIALTVASFINGINYLFGLFTGKSSLTILAEDLSEFAKILSGKDGFLTVMANFPEGAARGVKSLSEAFLYLTAGAFLNGINNLLSMFTGDAFSLEQFGKDISGLGTSLSSFVTGLLGPMMSMQLQMVGMGKAAGNDELSNKASEGLNQYVDTMVKVIEAASTAIKKLAEAQEALPRRGGLKTTFSGSVQTLNEFADGFKDLAEPLTKFSKALIDNKFDDDDIKAVSVAAEAVKDLAEAAGELPNDGTGIVADWTGRTQSLEAFSNQFPLVAGNLVKFAQALTTVVDPDTGKVSQYDWSSDVSNAVTTASQAIKAMADATSFLNSTGTKVTTTHHDKWWDFFDLFPTKEEVEYIDSLDITSFTNTFPIIAKALKDFTSVLSGENDLIYNQDKGKIYWYKLTEAKEGMKLNVDTIKDIVPIYSNMLSAITDFAKESKTQFGFGDSDLQTAVGNLEKIGPILTTLITEFEKDNYKVDNIDEFRSRIQNAGAILTEFNKSFDFKQTSSTIVQLSSNVLFFNKSYKTPDFKNVTNTLDAIKNFVDISLPKYDSTHMVEELNKIGALFDTFKNNLTSESYKPLKDFLDGFTNIGKDALAKLQSGFCDEITSNNGYRSLAAALSNFFTSIRGEAEKDRTESATSLKAKGEELGKDLLEGYTNGLSNSDLLSKVYAKAKAVSQKAVQGIADGQNSNSPSKEGMKLGNYLDQGFIIGINELKDRVYDSSFGIGKVATSGLSNSISRIAEAVNSDIDASPTIRPVLDLSDVQAGANTISSMFATPSVGLLNNLNSIGYGINSKIQNAGNNDVVSAIDKLGRSLSGGSSNTYNINGITYNDDSNINNAVRELINAIEVERRV